MELFAGALNSTTMVDYGPAERERFGDPVALDRAESVRPKPVESVFLSTAVEPVDWQHRSEPPAHASHGHGCRARNR